MTTLTIEIPNPKDVQLFQELVERLNGKIISKTQQPKVSAWDWIEQLAQANTHPSIENPVDWQRTTRQERKLPLRD